MYSCPTVSCFLQGETKRTRQAGKDHRAVKLPVSAESGASASTAAPPRISPALICADGTLRYADDRLHSVRCVISALLTLLCANDWPFHLGVHLSSFAFSFWDEPDIFGRAVVDQKKKKKKNLIGQALRQSNLLSSNYFLLTSRYQKGGNATSCNAYDRTRTLPVKCFFFFPRQKTLQYFSFTFFFGLKEQLQLRALTSQQQFGDRMKTHYSITVAELYPHKFSDRSIFPMGFILFPHKSF